MVKNRQTRSFFLLLPAGLSPQCSKKKKKSWMESTWLCPECILCLLWCRFNNSNIAGHKILNTQPCHYLQYAMPSFSPLFDATFCSSFPHPPFLNPLLHLIHILLSPPPPPPPFRPSPWRVSAVAFMKTRYSIMFTSSLSELHQRPHTSSAAYIDLTISFTRREAWWMNAL